MHKVSITGAGAGTTAMVSAFSCGLFLSFLDYNVKSSGQRPRQFSRTSEISRQSPTQVQGSFTTGLGSFLAHLSLSLHFYDRQAYHHVEHFLFLETSLVWFQSSHIGLLSFSLSLRPTPLRCVDARLWHWGCWEVTLVKSSSKYLNLHRCVRHLCDTTNQSF